MLSPFESVVRAARKGHAACSETLLLTHAAAIAIPTTIISHNHNIKTNQPPPKQPLQCSPPSQPPSCAFASRPRAAHERPLRRAAQTSHHRHPHPDDYGQQRSPPQSKQRPATAGASRQTAIAETVTKTRESGRVFGKREGERSGHWLGWRGFWWYGRA